MIRFWNSPGGSKLFDSNLMCWKSSNLTKRHIYVLKFLLDNKNSNNLIFNNQSKFKECICDYFEKNNIDYPKKPTPTHFYTPLQFVGFINKNENFEGRNKFELLITDPGENFLRKLKNNDFDNALEIYLNQLFDTKFPNDATSDNNLKLYPFLIMFKLLSENNDYNGIVSRKMFMIDIPFITKDNYKKILDKLNDNCYKSNLDNISNKFIQQHYDEKHLKWNMWIVSSLIDLGILKENNGYVTLSEENKHFIQKKVDKMTYDEMFFEE